MKRISTFAILLYIFTLSYTITPYWYIPGENWQKCVLWVVVSSLGLLWAYMASANVVWKFSALDWRALSIVVLAIGVVNGKALFSVIPWRGDEDFHIMRTLWLCEVLQQNPFPALVFALFSALFVGIAIRKPQWMKYFLVVLFIIAPVVVSCCNLPENFQGHILRYPYLCYWVFSMMPTIASPIIGLHHEILFRCVPLLVVTVLCGFVYHRLWATHKASALLWALLLATMPIVCYYTSILYLEMTAVLLMTVVCCNLKMLMCGDFSEMRGKFPWYCLILIGFIKETTLPFLLTFVACRTLYAIFSHRQFWLRAIWQEMQIAYCVVLPLAIYILYRKFFGDPRPFIPDFNHFLQLDIYVVFFYAYSEQFHLTFLLLAIGIAIFIYKKHHIEALFLALAFIADTGFHILDSQDYIGYSRFNLFLIPLIVCAGEQVLRVLCVKNSKLAVAILLIGIAANIRLMPLHTDGTKTPFWGSYKMDISGHYYPYDQALKWIKQNCPHTPIMFINTYYHYYLYFYFEKYNWRPQHVQILATEDLDLSLVLTKAAQHNYIVVCLYHVRDRELPAIYKQHGFQLYVFSNRAHSLFVYVK